MKNPAEKNMDRVFAGLAALCLLVLLSGVPAHAATYSWTGGDGDWSIGANWSPSGPPGADDGAWLSTSHTVNYDYDYGTNILYKLWINSGGTLSMSGAYKLAVLYEHIGYSGAGTFTHSQGTNESTLLYLGYNSGSSGTYTLSGTEADSKLSAAQDETIGWDGTGTFTQSGGTNTVGTALHLGRNSGSSGTYNLSGGSLDVGGSSPMYGAEYIGNLGTGEFTQSGGTHYVHAALHVGLNFGGGETYGGTYDLSDTGWLKVEGTEYIGHHGTGKFTQTGGTNIANGLILGHDLGAAGTYELSGGSLSVISPGTKYVGYEGTGTFIQSGGTHTVDRLSIGSHLGGTGTYDLSAGTNTVTNLLSLGHESGVGTGTYNLSDTGTLLAETVHVKETGEFTQTGGTLNIGTYNDLSSGLTNNGQFTLAGGTSTIHGEVVNHGTFKTIDTTVTFTGSYTENGAYISDPSTNNFNDWTIGETGYVTGGIGDIFNVAGDFINKSLQTVLWDTDQALLGFLGGTDHDFHLTGLDLGADMLGYSDNFAWGTLSIEDEDSLYLFDGNAVADGALYVSSLLGADIFEDTITNILFGGEDDVLNIYYLAAGEGNAYLGGLIYNLTGGGRLIPIEGAAVPIPGAVWLFGSGLLALVGVRRFKK